MRRGELEHIVRAAAEVVSDEIVVVGSQAAVGQALDPPEPLLVSMEADVYPLRNPERAIEIDAALGDGSRFHDQFGYYRSRRRAGDVPCARGMAGACCQTDASADGGWKNKAVGHLMEIHDVVLAKLVAGRSKDFEFADASIRSDLVDVENLRRGLDLMDEEDRATASSNLELVLTRIGASS